MDVFCFVYLWMYIICIFVLYSDMYNALAICTYVRHANKAI